MTAPSRSLRWLVLATLTGTVGVAQAGGFALIEHGASGMGNAYAGSAAVAADSSTVWFNPAAMVDFNQRHFSLAAHAIMTSTDHDNRGTTLNMAFGGGEISGDDDGSISSVTPVPNLYYLAPINERMAWGLAIDVPFGSGTEYDRDWYGRYSTVESAISVIEINPTFAYRINEQWSLGGGIGIQQLSATLGSALDSGAVCLGLAAVSDEDGLDSATCFNQGLLPGVQENDGYAEVDGDSWAATFNIGALFSPNENTRLGVTYRHGASHELEGKADFNNTQALAAILAGTGSPVYQDSEANAAVDLPATLSASVAHHLNDKVELLGDLTWTGWSSFDELRIIYDSGQDDTYQTQDWNDVWRASAGVNYRHNDKLTLRSGLAFDQSPITGPAERTPRIPGTDRTWLALGVGYKASDRISFDVGYAHLFTNEAAIDNTGVNASRGAISVRSQMQSSVDLLSAQINWHF